MPLLVLLLQLAIFGFVLYLITTYIPMPALIKQLIFVVAAIAIIFYLVDAFDGSAFLSAPHFNQTHSLSR